MYSQSRFMFRGFWAAFLVSGALFIAPIGAQEAAEPTSTPKTEISEEHPPPMKNKTIARWGTAFMLATSAAFGCFGLYVIYKSPNSMRNRTAPRGEDELGE